jgi:hypothetical protein
MEASAGSMTLSESELIRKAISIAEHVLASRFRNAACGFVAGSILRGQGTVGSDIDLVVIYDRVDAAWRESFIDGGFPIEAFVHDPETLDWFIDQDIELGYPIMADMVATGHVIGGDVVRANALKAHALSIVSKGPLPLTAKSGNGLRYVITDLLDDLRGKRSSAEIRAIAAQLFQPLADLTLLGRGTWSGKGKWIPRLLDKLDPQLARDFDDAFRLAADGNSSAILALAENELTRHGGPLFAGDKREAPSSARRAADAGQGNKELSP